MSGAKAPIFIGKNMFNLIFNSDISNSLKTKIYNYFEKYNNAFLKYFPKMSDVDIYFSHAQKANPEISKNQKVWGVAHLKDNFMEFVIFEDDFSEADFVQNIFHELNHVFRGFYERNFWLMADIISEGLAVSFEKQVRNETGIFWEDKPFYYFENEKAMILKRLAEAIDICKNKKECNYDVWLYNFNGENPDFPHNLGYKIGDFLVSEYCKFHKIKPIEAVRIPTMEFIKFAKKEILKCEK